MHYREAPRKVSTDWPPKFMKVLGLASRLFAVIQADRRRSVSCTFGEKATTKLNKWHSWTPGDLAAYDYAGRHSPNRLSRH